jgi:hypothetical protein
VTQSEAETNPEEGEDKRVYPEEFANGKWLETGGSGSL